MNTIQLYYFSTFKGSCTEKTAKDYNLSREEQDEFAINSYKKTASAHEVLQVTNVSLFNFRNFRIVQLTFFLIFGFREVPSRLKLCLFQWHREEVGKLHQIVTGKYCSNALKHCSVNKKVFDIVARDLPGGKRSLVINMMAQHITFNKAIKPIKI